MLVDRQNNGLKNITHHTHIVKCHCSYSISNLLDKIKNTRKSIIR